MIELPRNPRRRDLVVFGLLMGPFFAFLGWLVFRHAGRTPAYAVWGAGGLLWLVYLAWPAARPRIWIGWMVAVFPVGWIVSHAILTVVYFLVLTPVGILLRLTGRDPLARRRRKREETAWTPRRAPEDDSRYFRQF